MRGKLGNAVLLVLALEPWTVSTHRRGRKRSLVGMTRWQIFKILKDKIEKKLIRIESCSYPGIRKAIRSLERSNEVIPSQRERHAKKVAVRYRLTFKGFIHALAAVPVLTDVELQLQYAEGAINSHKDVFQFPFFQKAEMLRETCGSSIYEAFIKATIKAAEITWERPPLPPLLDREPALDRMKAGDLELELARDQISPFWPKTHILGATKYTPKTVITRNQEIEEKKGEYEWLREIRKIAESKREEYLKEGKAPDKLWGDAFGLNFTKICPWPSRKKMQRIISDPQISHFVRDILKNAESRLEDTRKAIKREEKALQELRMTIFGRRPRLHGI